MNIVVTGGAGFIGSHACKLLASRGFQPIVVDDLSRGNRSSIKWGPLEEGNVGDSSFLMRVLHEYQPRALMHFAAYAYVGESVRDPLLYYANNVVATVSMLRTVLDYGSMPVVFSSSCATYGVPNVLPIDEEHPQLPINPYGFSKLVVERMLTELDNAAGLKSVILRYFNAAGSDPDCEIGESHEPETHIIPLVLSAALDGKAISIFGNDYDTPDGTCVRDYVHVVDIAEAHVLALEYLLRGGKSCALNLANSTGHSIKEVVATAERLCAGPVAIVIAPRRSGDPAILVGSNERARMTLGWQPTRSKLEDQMVDTLRWLQNQRLSTT